MSALPPLLWSLIDLNGTASRKRGWLVLGVLVLVLVGIDVLGAKAPSLRGVGLFAVSIALALYFVALVQRLHDAGRSGYWALMAQVPVLGLVAAITILCLAPSDAPPRGHPVARQVGAGVLVALVLLGLSRAVLWEPFWIPAESMKPTLLVGDFLIAKKIDPEDIALGDVVVFGHPVNGADYIKRVVGLPGDTIQVRDGVLYINGVAAPQEAAGVFEEAFKAQGPMEKYPRCENGAVGEGDVCRKSRFVETLPDGRKFEILNIDASGVADMTEVFTVPMGHYFVMGDNRDNSLDSRFAWDVGGIGFLPAENVRARAWFILFSSAGDSLYYFWTWRADRFLKVVE